MNIESDKSVEKLVLQAFHNKDLQKVIEIAGQLKEQCSYLYYPYLWLGHAYKELAEYKKSKYYFNILVNQFPDEIFGLEGLALVALEEKDWCSQIKYANLFQEKFPDLYHSYLWLGHAHKEIGEYQLAEYWFNVMEQKFSNQVFGLEGLYLVAEHQKNWALCFERACQFQEKFPDNIMSYKWIWIYYNNMEEYNNADKQAELIRAKFPDMGHFGLYEELYRKNNLKEAIKIRKPAFTKDGSKSVEYIILLLKHQLYIQAETYIQEWQNFEIKSKRLRYYLLQAQALICQSSRNFKEAYRLFQEALSYKEIMGSYYVNIILSAAETYKQLKLYDEYAELIDGLISSFSFREDVYLTWANIAINGKSLYVGCGLKAERLQQALKKLPYSQVLNIQYIDTLMSIGKLDTVEHYMAILLKKHSQNFIFMSRYAKLHHHKKDWRKSYLLYSNLYKKYPNKYDDNFYCFANTLLMLNKIDELRKYTHQYNKHRYSNLLLREDLDDFQVDLMIGNYCASKPSLYPVSMYLRCIDSLKSNFFRVEPVINNIDSEVLIICFEGSHSAALDQYRFDRFETADLLDEAIRRRDGYHHYRSFANNNKQFNFLLVSDYTTSYYQANHQFILQTIKKHIHQINSKYVVCMGESAGGLASFIFAKKLNADLVFSFMPRLQAFAYSLPSEYQRAIQLACQAFNPEDLDCGYVQYKNSSLPQKSYIVLCENEPSDAISVRTLNHKDVDLHISYCYGDMHVIIAYLGAKNVYREMIALIEEECKHNFKLPIQKDFLRNVAGYKYSSVDEST